MNPQFEKIDNQTRIEYKEIANNKMCDIFLKSLKLSKVTFSLFSLKLFSISEWDMQDDS